MCRTTDFDGFQLGGKDATSLRIKAFYLRFIPGSVEKPNTPLPESLTLLFLPRIDETDLSINGSKIRPDVFAFLPLYRIVDNGEPVFGSRERVRASEGVRFEVYYGEVRVLEGIFIKNEDQNWKLDLKSGLEEEQTFLAADVAEVCVGLEGHVAMSDRVEIRNRRKKSNNNNNNNKLEVILERREEVEESDGACCWECEGDGSDGGEACERIEMDLEGVRWAVDVGIWVMCLGVGYLVSKASAKSLRRSLRRSGIL